MKNRVAHVTIFLVVLLGVYIHSQSPSFFQPRAVVTGVQSDGHWTSLHLKACPAFFFRGSGPEDHAMRDLVRETIHAALPEAPPEGCQAT